IDNYHEKEHLMQMSEMQKKIGKIEEIALKNQQAIAKTQMNTDQLKTIMNECQTQIQTLKDQENSQKAVILDLKGNINANQTQHKEAIAHLSESLDKICQKIVLLDVNLETTKKENQTQLKMIMENQEKINMEIKVLQFDQEAIIKSMVKEGKEIIRHSENSDQ